MTVINIATMYRAAGEPTSRHPPTHVLRHCTVSCWKQRRGNGKFLNNFPACDHTAGADINQSLWEADTSNYPVHWLKEFDTYFHLL